MGHISLHRYPWSEASDNNIRLGSNELDVLRNTKLNQYFIEAENCSSEKIQVELVDEPTGYVLKRDAHFYAAKDHRTMIYTLPCVLMASSINSDYQDDNSVRSHRFKVRCNNVDLGYVVIPLANSVDDFSYLLEWLTFFDYIIESNKSFNSFSQNIVRFVYLKKIIQRFCGDQNTPIRSKILEIMENTSKTIDALEFKLRKNLTRTRDLMPVERINELDAKCLLSLLKIEGRTIRDKARSNNMKLLGIKKVESYNMLENRVLKDFLYRCNNEINRYFSDDKKYSRNINSSTTSQLKLFKSKCLALFNNPNLADTPRQISLPKPNFVLQQNIYYKKIWHYYLDLVNSKKDIQKTMLWQQNLFQDVADMLLNVAITDMVGKDPQGTGVYIKAITRSYTDISREILGNSHRLKSSCNAGPFILSKLGKLYSVEIISNSSLLNNFENYSDMSELFSIGAPTYIIFNEITDNDYVFKESYAIAVYTLHNIVTETGRDDINKYLANLRRSIDFYKNKKINIHPWLIVSVDKNIKDISSRFAVAYQDDIYLSQIELNPYRWHDDIGKMQKALWAFIRGQIDAQ